MGFLDLQQPIDSDERFVGTWRLLKADGGVDVGEAVTMTFTADGKLVYVIHQKESDQIMNLFYMVNGNYLITNQASEPREEKTLFDFDSDGNLILDYGGSKTWFARA
jgi:hypothetical protein